jgi:hypothetical protein
VPSAWATRTSASKTRAAPRCTSPVSNLAVNVSIHTVKGARSAGVKAAPAVKSSYWVRLLENACPSTVMTSPLYPHSEFQPSPTSITTKLRWNKMLPNSRR